MNNGLISRSKAIEELNYLKHIGYDNSGVMKLQNMEIQRCISAIEDVPAVEERPQGKWLVPYKYKITKECSICHRQMPAPKWFKFCPNCGAEMQKAGAE